MNGAIAVVGMACCYPGADSPEQLWENILARRKAFRRFPAERINLDDYLADKNDPGDTFYTAEAAVIEGYQFDRVKYHVAGRTFRSVDMAHWLALDVAANALSDAGFGDSEDLPKQTTGVFVGNTLTGEFSRSALLRLRWPYVRRVFDERLRSLGWDREQRQSFLEDAEIDFKAPFEPVNEETLAGGLSNTIAGRICNHFDLSGGGYTLDGACSSSLLALANACDALTTGGLNAAVVGGVDLSLDPFELIGFAKVGALADGDMRVYDRNSHGFLPGEGCGFVVLMRHEDAIARNLPCYAVIRGWGISSDGNGGITRPEVQGQRLALQRAYQRAGYAINSVGLFEGHGTGTKVGDEVELSALVAELSIEGSTFPAAISSIKANIGHTKAAAGIAGFIKATLALHHQILPPATGVYNQHPILHNSTNVLRALKQGSCWPQNRPRRAGVSSFGFGGINVHITLEANNPSQHKSILSIKEKKQLASFQDAELFVFGEQNLEKLKQAVQHLSAIAPRLSHAELIDVAAQLANQCSAQSNVRAAMTASTPVELNQRLEILLNWLNQGTKQRIDVINSVFLGSGNTQPRIAFLFPGQAAPVRLNGGLMAGRFADLEALYQSIELTDNADDGLSTEVAQPAIIAAQLAGLQLMQRFGIIADSVLGHSLGELSALYWSGVIDQVALLRLAKIRGLVMDAAPAGAMAGIGAESRQVSTLLESENDIVIAGFNAANQTVIAGETKAVNRFVAAMQERGIMATVLPVAHAFHSPFMQSVAAELNSYLEKERFQPLSRAFFSSVTGTKIQGNIAFADLLTQQLTTPVRFTDAVSGLLSETDLAIEVGPGTILGGLLREQPEVPVISLDVAGSSLVGLLQSLSCVYALGGSVNIKALFEDRFYRSFNSDWKPIFFANPCESAPRSEYAITANKNITKPVESTVSPSDSSQSALEVVMQLVAARTELPLAALHAEKRLLADLHLNSISVAELLVAASREMNIASPAAVLDYSNVTIAELAEGLQAIQTAGSHAGNQFEQFPAGVDNWVRSFTLNKKPCPLQAKEIVFKGNGLWHYFSAEPNINLDSILEKLNNWGGSGVLLYLPAEFTESDIPLLLKATRSSLNSQETPRYFILLQAQNGIASSVIKTLHLESQQLTTLVMEAPEKLLLNQERIIAELQAAKGYTEVYFDEKGRRWLSTFDLLPLTSEHVDWPLDTSDVLLVTGGGKGIAAECALMLALETHAKLAIVGRSNPEIDLELAGNLKRFSAYGIQYRYLQADVCNADELCSAVNAVESDFGAISGILHSAGVNHPQLLSALDEAAFQRTLAPKVKGLHHLLAAINAQKLKLLINFGSIIARSGMRGEADYALANAWQTQILEQFNSTNPDCRCLSVEWSVWSGVGMGERLGRIDALLREGINPILPAQGVEILRQLIACKLPYNSVIVTGRLGELPTLKLERPELPFLRFLERSRIYYPGVELIVEADLSTDSDPYLQDHVFQGEQLLPGVMGLEAMAQVAMALTEKLTPPNFEQVEFLHPLVINKKEKVVLRIAGLTRKDNTVEVVIRCSKTNFLVDHFRALCVFVGIKSEKLSTLQINSPSAGMSVAPKTELYGSLFFHSGRFVRVSHYHFFNAWQCSAEIESGLTSNWFGRYLPQNLVLGDPGSRDAALHAIQACIPQSTIVPISIDKLVMFDTDHLAKWTVRAQERSHEHDIFVYDLEIIDGNGQCREYWQGLKLKAIASQYHENWLEALLPPYLERQIEAMTETKVNIAMLRDSLTERPQRSDAVIQQALGVDREIFRRADGKPYLMGHQHYLSVAHSGDLSLAVTSSNTVSCDLERIVDRDNDFWLAVFDTERLALVEQLMKQPTGENFNYAASRVWTIQECLKKAECPLNAPLTIKYGDKSGWLVLAAGEYLIGSFIAQLRNSGEVFALAVLAQSQSHTHTVEKQKSALTA